MSTLSLALISALAGSFAAWIDWHNREVQPTVLVLLVTTCFLAAFRPRQAWLCAVIVGGSVPFSYLVISPVLGLRPFEMPQPNIWGSLIAFIPAAIGAAAGAACGVVVRAASH